MDQLVVLQEIYESFSKGGEGLHSIDTRSIEGKCSDQVSQLLEGSKQGKIDAALCSRLADCLQDTYEIKRLGDICKRAGLLELAIRCYEQALSKTGDKSVKAVLLNNLGQVYGQFGDLGRAVAYYKKAVRRFECVNDRSGLAHVQGNLGSAYRRAHEWDKAIEHCYKSLNAFEEQGDKLGAAQMTGSLGRVYAEMGEVDLAARYFEKSLKDFQKLGDRRSEAWVLNRLGKVSAQRNLDSSVKYYNQSLSIFEDLGHEQSSGIVLANLGRSYLDKDEASLARDYLEQSLKLLRKETEPAYSNASAWLASTYCNLAKKHLEEARRSLSGRANSENGEAEGQLKLAAQYYSRGADRYRDLRETSQLPEISMVEWVAKLLSILAELQAEKRDEVAFKLAGEAISSLKEVSRSAGKEAEQIKAIQRTLSGMRAVWSLSQISKEPWKLAGSVALSIEHLMGGFRLPGETGVCIYNALKSLRDAIDAEQQRGDPFERLRASASSLRTAERRLQSENSDLGNDSAIGVGNAAALIERLISMGTGQGKAVPSNISELLNYRAHRNALLQIGWVLVRNALPAIDKTGYVYTWDESMNLVEAGSAAKRAGEPSAGQHQSGEPEAITMAQQTLSSDTVIEESDEDEEMDPIECISKPESMIEKNTIAEMDAGEALFADEPIVEVAPQGGSLVPVITGLVYSSSSGRIIEQLKERPKRIYRSDRFMPGPDVNASDGRESTLVDVVETQSQTPPTHTTVPQEPIGFGASWENPNFSAASTNTEKLYAFGNGLFTMYNAVKIVKVLVVAVLVLLAIDLVLYFWP